MLIICRWRVVWRHSEIIVIVYIVLKLNCPALLSLNINYFLRNANTSKILYFGRHLCRSFLQNSKTSDSRPSDSGSGFGSGSYCSYSDADSSLSELKVDHPESDLRNRRRSESHYF